MTITYIVRIRAKMSYLLVQNLNLLNKMHEGLIVVEESDMDLKFANTPAINLINQLPSKKVFPSIDDSKNRSHEQTVTISQEDLSKTLFTQATLSLMEDK